MMATSACRRRRQADLEAVRSRHGNVQQHEVGLVPAGRVEAGGAIQGGVDLEALIGQAPLQQRHDLGVVVH
jgi:hypothetical protein